MIIWNCYNQKLSCNKVKRHIKAILNDSGATITSNKTVINAPIPNNPKSNLVNIPNINVPLLALAGIK